MERAFQAEERTFQRHGGKGRIGWIPGMARTFPWLARTFPWLECEAAQTSAVGEAPWYRGRVWTGKGFIHLTKISGLQPEEWTESLKVSSKRTTVLWHALHQNTEDWTGGERTGERVMSSVSVSDETRP